MKIGVFGTGDVGRTIGTKLVQLGHVVKMGGRTADSEDGVAWAKETGGKGGSMGTYADAAAHGELVFNCTPGTHAVDVLKAAGAKNLDGKIVIDVSNPLDFSKGMPPTLTVVNDDSVGERLQKAFPGAKVVKTLNTVNCKLMVDASRVGSGDTTMFVCGDDAAAKKRVVDEVLTGWFGWKDVIDLGGIAQARGTEMFLPLWVRLYGALRTPEFNVKVVR